MVRVVGGLLVSASTDTTIRVWDLTTNACVSVLEGHTHEVLQGEGGEQASPEPRLIMGACLFLRNQRGMNAR